MAKIPKCRIVGDGNQIRATLGDADDGIVLYVVDSESVQLSDLINGVRDGAAAVLEAIKGPRKARAAAGTRPRKPRKMKGEVTE